MFRPFGRAGPRLVVAAGRRHPRPPSPSFRGLRHQRLLYAALEPLSDGSGARLRYQVVVDDRRPFSTTALSAAWDSSSKVEETVKRLRRKQDDKLKELARVEDLKKDVQMVMDRDKAEEEEKEKQTKELEAKKEKKSLWVRFKAECQHYYSGFKLLFLDIRVTSKILYKVAKGNTLTRRENRQLVRTVSDLFRLVPFSVFVIVPFMEFLLPVALKLFPGMLPSTFTTSQDRDAKMRRQLKAKLEYAKFLQKTLDDMAPTSGKDRNSKSARDFVEFYQNVKEEGLAVKNEDIVRFSQLFEDEITLDNMERSQLVALCRLLELTPMGTNNFLVFQLEMKLRQLKIDDKVIHREGVENLDVEELQAACKERGMRAFGLSEKSLRHQLEQWLDLSLNNNIPPSLLLLSRTLYLPDNLDTTAQIATAISALPEKAAARASAAIGEREGKIRNVVRLEVIKEEQRRIEEEAAEAEEIKKEEDVKKDEEEVKEEERKPEEVKKRVITARSIAEGAAQKEEAIPALRTLLQEAKSKVRRVKQARLEEQLKEEELLVEEKDISFDDLADIKNAIYAIGKGNVDESDIKELQQELKDYEEDLEDLKFIKAEAGRFDLQESKGAKRLFSMVNHMLGRVDGLVNNLQEKEKELAERILEKESSKWGEQSDGTASETDEENLVTVHELIDAVRKLKTTEDSSKVEHIAEVLGRMDEDKDGVVKVSHVLKVIELLGAQQKDLRGQQINKIIEMLAKEEMLEVESNIEKALTSYDDILEEDKGSRTTSEKLNAVQDNIEAFSEEINKSDDDNVISRKIEEEAEMVDKAKDLTEHTPEEHIREMFDEEPKKAQMSASGEGNDKGDPPKIDLK